MEDEGIIIAQAAGQYRLHGPIDEIISRRVPGHPELNPVIFASCGTDEDPDTTVTSYVLSTMTLVGVGDEQEDHDYEEYNRIHDCTDHEARCDYAYLTWRVGPKESAVAAATGMLIIPRTMVDGSDIDEHLGQLGFAGPEMALEGEFTDPVFILTGLEAGDEEMKHLLTHIAADVVEILDGQTDETLERLIITDDSVDPHGEVSHLTDLADQLQEMGHGVKGIEIDTVANQAVIRRPDNQGHHEDLDDDDITMFQLKAIMGRPIGEVENETLDDLLNSNNGTPAERRAALSQVMAFIVFEGRHGWEDDATRIMEAIKKLPQPETPAQLWEKAGKPSGQINAGEDTIPERTFQRSASVIYSNEAESKEPDELLMGLIVTQAAAEAVCSLLGNGQEEDLQKFTHAEVLRYSGNIAARHLSKTWLAE